jgi:hypothetical protein
MNEYGKRIGVFVIMLLVNGIMASCEDAGDLNYTTSNNLDGSHNYKNIYR